jgi:oligopeptidase B
MTEVHRLTPPMAERRPHVVSRHGDRFEDPWFWLRNRDDPAVRAYLEAENAYAREVLPGTESLQRQLYDEMLGRIQQTDVTAPFPDGDFWYYSRTEEGKQYPIHCRRYGGLEAPEQVVLDLNLLAQGKPFLALGEFDVSDDGSLLVYSVDETGYRDYRLQVKDLRTGSLLPVAVERVGTANWAADGRTLFYTVEDHAKRPYRVYRHVIGTEQHVLVAEEPDEAFRLVLDRTRSGAYLLLVAASHTTTEVRLLPAARPEDPWRLVAPRRPEIEYDLDHQGDRVLIRVNDTGRTFRLVEAPVEDPGPERWRELVPARAEVMLEAVDCFAGHAVLSERVDGLPRLRVLAAAGGDHLVPFPDSLCEASLGPNRVYQTPLLRYHYESLTVPHSVYDYDMAARATELKKRIEVLGGYDPDRYRTERVHAVAPDGTRIPVSLVYQVDRPRHQPGPLLLKGYGAYGLPYPLDFSSNRVSLLDRGLAVAIAHIRGGGDLGKPWHDQGRMRDKMNTFTDFIAAAEHLIAEGWTAPEQLVIEGGSAGGLLMGAVVNLRPELFRAVVSQVPFVDVLNTMSDRTLPLTVGEFEEWGNPADPEHYAWIRAYDPYANLRRGAYPVMLVRTAFNDSQVMYWEPAKYVARLRALKTDDRPLLLVTNMGAGHGGASGRYDRLREIALDYAFMLWALSLASDD